MIDARAMFEEVRMFQARFPVSGWVIRVMGLVTEDTHPHYVIENPISIMSANHDGAERAFVVDLVNGTPRAVEGARLMDKYDSACVAQLVGKYGGGDG